ncbi:SURF6-domain-containing protein [Piromyces finnis]|uniref:SURF6-domain-containing protein n=1 Tax=Piromyces finnis TaxID=1754191 RepID=A0A1Y1VK80_9FUNG|nr:SURF6-domain-containing protein [Piromyces finnis]|eukprot:ORX58493.1 SURF6-domain-containing protein [Piromyces finnis]
MIFDIDKVEEHIESHNSFFDDLIGLIPASHYLPKAESEIENDKYYHNTKKQVTSTKLNAKEIRKNKKAKFDPNNVKSVQTLQEEKKMKEEEEAEEEDTSMNMVQEVDIKDLKPMSKTSSITELQERLKKSIDDLRAKRKAQNNNSIHSRDELLKKRLKRKHDRKEQIQKKKEKRRKTNDMVGMDLPETQASKDNKSAGAKEVEENVSFGKIVFNEELVQKKKKGPTDTLGRLKQVEANKEKLEKLKSVDKEKAEALEEKIQWNKAMKLVEGEKIKDDPKLLKKTLKREQKLKERSTKKWNDRQKTVARQMKEKQKKREENIKNRMNNKGKGSKGVSRRVFFLKYSHFSLSSLYNF